MVRGDGKLRVEMESGERRWKAKARLADLMRKWSIQRQFKSFVSKTCL